MKRAKSIVTILAILYGILVLVILLKPDDAFSFTERRKLAQKPKISWESIKSGAFMAKTEEYAADQFPGRDAFRSAKTIFSMGVLQNKDTNGIYYKDGYLAKMEYPLDEVSVKRAFSVFKGIKERYFEGTNVIPYICVIPDKNYVLAEEEYLALDYQKMISMVETGMDFAWPISIVEDIQISDFYKTDTHWKQEEITDIAKKIGQEMGTQISGEYTKKCLDSPFYGVYYGQSGLPVAPDHIAYCSNEVLEQCRVYDHENGKEILMYDPAKAEGRDPYELFLGGNISLVTIENPSAASQKELVVFGDSFSRSLVPLLAEGYQKTTLVDIRYLPSVSLGEYVSFMDQDVLFIYSASVLNNSATLK